MADQPQQNTTNNNQQEQEQAPAPQPAQEKKGPPQSPARSEASVQSIAGMDPAEADEEPGPPPDVPVYDAGYDADDEAEDPFDEHSSVISDDQDEN